jgi:hypothetical protein
LEYPEEFKEVLTRLLMDDVPDPTNAKALEYPEDANEVLTMLLIDDVPDPMNV